MSVVNMLLKDLEAAVTDVVFHCSLLDCSVLHCSVLRCSVLYCTALYCSVQWSRW